MSHARYIAIGLYTNSLNIFAKSFINYIKSISPNIIATKHSRYMAGYTQVMCYITSLLYKVILHN